MTRLGRLVEAGVAGTLATLVLAALVAAECTGQPNRWLAFTDVAPTAASVVVGRVTEGFGEFPDWTQAGYRVDVTHVLKGLAPSVLEIRSRRSGLRLRGTSACRSDAYLGARVGDVIAFAFDGRLPGIAKPITTAAWIEGRPDPYHVPGAQRLTLAEVRSAVSSLPPTATSTEDQRSAGSSVSVAMLALAFAGSWAWFALRRRAIR